jgi:RNA polymerase sigma factor (sigma-70 family)
MPTDLELLARWRDGDDAAGEALIRAHYSAIFGQIRAKVLGDTDLAAELTQRVFEVLLHKRDAIVENVGAYLHGIARRKLIEHFRGRRPASDPDPALSQVPAPDAGVATLLDRRHDAALLARALRSLPEDDQRLLLWAYADGLTQRAIGARLGLSKQQVNGRIDRARDKLRRCLEALAESDEQRASVSSGFETWVASVRRRVEGGEPPTS